jgi:DMSO/TMAO reductase YedYZ molybdopterin-dependent catalytic subunit
MSTMDDFGHDRVSRRINRRTLLHRAGSGALVTALAGGLYMLDDRATAQARKQKRGDGRPRLPPGQRVISALDPMGGSPGSPSRRDFRLRVHGEVERSYTLDFAELLAMGPVERTVDVHCVTGWSVLGATWKGIRLCDLAAKARPHRAARFVVFEAAHGYTANVRADEVMGDDVLVAWELDGRPLQRPHGAPVRAVVPDLYFWKSAKWLTGIRFSRRDEPGFWEKRGYHNHADPWKEERHG